MILYTLYKWFSCIARDLCRYFAASLLLTAAAMSTQATITTGNSSSATATSTTVPNTIAHLGAGARSEITGCGNLTPAIPNGVAPAGNNLLIASVIARDTGTNINTTPAGWTLYATSTYAGQALKVFIYYRMATSTSGAADAVTFTTSGTCSSTGAIVARFSNVDSASPIFPAAGAAVSTQSNSSNITSGSIDTTTVSAVAMLVVSSYINDNRTVAATGFSESFDEARNVVSDYGHALHYQLQTTAGVKQVTGWSMSGGGSDPNIDFIYALRPSTTLVNPTGLTLAVPAGTAAGDVMIATIAISSNAAVTAHADWTLVNRVDHSDTRSAQIVYTRVVDGTEPASYNWTFTGTTDAAGAIITYSGVETAAPVDQISGTETASSTSHSSSSITTAYPNAMVISVHGFTSSENWVTAPAGMSPRINIASITPANAAGLSLAVYDVLQSSAGATGNKTAVAGGNADTGITHILDLRPRAVVRAEYRMDESWTVPGASVVLDYSGNSNHGDAVASGGGTPISNSNAVPALGDAISGTCGYGVFPASGGQNNQNAVDSRLAPGDTGSASFWYSSDVAWVGSGNTKLLDASFDASNRFFLTMMDSGALRFRLEVGGNVSQAQTAVQGFGANTWVHIAITWNLANNLTEIYINGTLSATSTSSVGTGSSWDTLYIGDNRADLGGQGNTGNSAGGLIDEVRIYDGVITQTVVDQDRFSTHACSQVDHYRISFPSGDPGTCDPGIVEVTAHDFFENVINVGSGIVLSFSTASGAGVWGPSGSSPLQGSGAWSPSGLDNGMATYIWPGGEGVVQVNLSHSASITDNINLYDGTASEAAANPLEDPDIVFSSNPVIRITSDGTSEGTVTTEIAGKDSDVAPGQTLYIQLKQSGVAVGGRDACEVPGQYSGTASVTVAVECVDPATCPTQQVTVNGTPVSGIYHYASGTVPSPLVGTGINFTFDGSGDVNDDNKAALVFNYPDAGSIKLYFELTMDPSGPASVTPSLTFAGATNAYVVRPFGFRIDNFSPANPAAVDENGSVFTKAGVDFSADLSAVVWESGDDSDNDGVPDSNDVLIAGTPNTVTPNFGNETTPVTVNLSHTLVAPSAAGAQSGVLTGAGLFSGFVNGVLAGKTMSWNEVGIIQLNLNEGNNNYLAGGEDITGVVPYVGRFTPANLTVVAQGATTFADTCSAGSTPFTYQDQAFYFGPAANDAPRLRVRGVDANGDVTVNYDSNEFYKLSTALTRSYADQTGAAANFEPPIIDTDVTVLNLDNYNGNIDLRLDNDTNGDVFMYSRVSAEAPFAASVLLTFDAAGLVDADGICYDGDGDGLCEVNGDDDFVFGTIGGATLRFGRLNISKEVSSEVIDMNVPITAEYYNGTGFVVNPDDQCTGVANTDLTLSNTLQTAETDGDIQICEAGGTSIMSVTNNPFAAGDGLLTFTAPGAACEGSTDILIDLSVLGLDHLQYDWSDDDGMQDGPYSENPTGRATFGIISRPKEVIYTREPWN